MIYNLIFTIYTLVVLFILTFTFASKHKIRTVRSRTYVFLIITCFVFALFECVSLIIYKYVTINPVVTQITWSLKIIGMFYYIYFFFVYYNLITKGNKYEKLLDELFKVPKFLIGFIFITIFVFAYLIFNRCTSYDLNNLAFVRGIFAHVLLVVCLAVVLSALISGFNKRHENINLFRSLSLFFLIFVIALPLQVKFIYISLMPFICGFICYVIYYNLENPDIKLVEEIEKLKNSIDSSNNTKTSFLFNMSYDLINPINTIVSLSNSIENSVNFDKNVVLEDVNNIKLVGNALLESINNIFEMFNNNLESSEKEYSLYELISRVRSVCETRIGAKQIKFETNIDDNLYSKYIGDINKIQKVLLNVTNNAVRFTDVGKIIFSISSSGNIENNVLHFKIVDTGIGIKDEEKPFIFTDSDSSKTSVGLSASKKFVNEMGGSIRFDSVYGGGTKFYIDLPQKPSGSKLISEDIVDSVSSNIIDYTDLSNYRVLIVDDDNLDIKVISRLLEKYKIKAEVCMSTIEFIDKIKADEVYDLVFLDHKMNELDGVETVKLLRSLDGYTLPKIVSLTANASSGAREYYKSVGFDEYLSKPIDVHELDRILKKNLK